MTNSLVSWQLDAANQKIGVAGWSAETVHLSVDKLSAPGYYKKIIIIKKKLIKKSIRNMPKHANGTIPL